MQEPVTSANRKQYVQLYMEWIMEKSIATQFNAFCHGFLRVSQGLLSAQSLDSSC